MNPSKTYFRIFRVKHNGNTARPNKTQLRAKFGSEKSAMMTLRHHGKESKEYEIRKIRQILPKETGRTTGI